MKKVIIVIIAILSISLIGLLLYISSRNTGEESNRAIYNNAVSNISTDENEVEIGSNMDSETSFEIRTALKNKKWLRSKATMEKTFLGEDVSENITWKFFASNSGDQNNIFVLAEDESNSLQVFAITYESGKVVATPVLSHVVDASKETISVDIDKGMVEAKYSDEGYQTSVYYLVSRGQVYTVNTIGFYPEYGNNGQKTGKSIYYSINTENTISESEYNKLKKQYDDNYNFENSFVELNAQNIDKMIK